MKYFCLVCGIIWTGSWLLTEEIFYGCRQLKIDFNPLALEIYRGIFILMIILPLALSLAYFLGYEPISKQSSKRVWILFNIIFFLVVNAIMVFNNPFFKVIDALGK